MIENMNTERDGLRYPSIDNLQIKHHQNIN